MQKTVNRNRSRYYDVHKRVASLHATYLEFEDWFLTEPHYGHLSKRDTIILKSISSSLYNIVSVYGKVR